jgi:hypothetical protein
MSTITWPRGKRFAFSIFDDTDLALMPKLVPIYDLLGSLGFRTTKSVWPLSEIEPTPYGGLTCQDQEYLNWVKSLQQNGFEIGYHMARAHSSRRADAIAGLDTFRDCFGHDPYTMANHSANRENIYWGGARLSGIRAQLYDQLLEWKSGRTFTGHVEGDEYFWGDICLKRVKYVRSFSFRRLNHLPLGPSIPYYDPSKPFVAAWFTSAHGPDCRSLSEIISEAEQDRLEEEGGVAIIYTHLAAGFIDEGKFNPQVERLLKRLASKGGWFVPVHAILDHLRLAQGIHTLTDVERISLEYRWLLDQSKLTRRYISHAR